MYSAMVNSVLSVKSEKHGSYFLALVRSCRCIGNVKHFRGVALGQTVCLLYVILYGNINLPLTGSISRREKFVLVEINRFIFVN